MLPLKYLEHDTTLYKDILNYWAHDDLQNDLCDQFRISSNAIYPFYNQSHIEFLRFAPSSEKAQSFIHGEISFVEFLSLNGLKVPDFVTSKKGTKMITHVLNETAYNATVMTNVGGTRLDRLHLSDALIHKYGSTLARLHKISATNTEHFNRPSYKNAFTFIREKLITWPNAIEALDELEKVFEHLPHSRTEFGLIHYDYELDNVFFISELDEMAVIDFDDSMYHFYAMDLIKALANLEEECVEMERTADEIQKFKEAFLLGYQSILPLPTLLKSHGKAFERFQCLLACARMSYALETASYRSEDWALGLIDRFKQEIKKDLECPLKPIL